MMNKNLENFIFITTKLKCTEPKFKEHTFHCTVRRRSCRWRWRFSARTRTCPLRDRTAPSWTWSSWPGTGAPCRWTTRSCRSWRRGAWVSARPAPCCSPCRCPSTRCSLWGRGRRWRSRRRTWGFFFRC